MRFANYWHRDGRLVTIAAASILFVGCIDSPTPPETLRRSQVLATERAHAELTAAAQGRTARGFEDEILRLETRVPGVGGAFRNSDGDFTIYVTDDTKGAAAQSEFRAAAPRLALEADVRARLASGSGVVVRHGDFAFSELIAWERILLAKLAVVRGFWEIDADESRNRLSIQVVDDAARAAVQSVLAQSGTPANMAIIEIGQTPALLGTLFDRPRPTHAGYQIANDVSGLCTLGFNVLATSVGNGFITASHCSGATLGQGGVNNYMHQPTKGNGTQNRVGVVNTDPPWNRTDAECNAYTLCTLADAMFVKYQNSPADTGTRNVVMTSYVGTNYAIGSTTTVAYFRIQYGPWGSGYVGLVVDKVGTRTGWTRGSISGTCTYDIQDGAMFLCTDKVTGSSVGHGDSGAPTFVYTYDGVYGNQAWPLGLLYAGQPGGSEVCTAACTYWYSPWSNIVSHLGLALTVTTP